MRELGRICIQTIRLPLLYPIFIRQYLAKKKIENHSKRLFQIDIHRRNLNFSKTWLKFA